VGVTHQPTTPDFGKVLVPVPAQVPVLAPSPVPVPDNIEHNFPTTKILYKIENLAFSMSEAALFTRKF
jgi:hypothetical protein